VFFEEEFGMRTILCTLAVLGLVVGANAGDFNPAQLGKATGKSLGKVDSVPPPQPVNPGEEFCNTLGITDSQSYFNGYGNTWGGSAIFGSTQDLQAAQACEIPGDCELDECTVDHICLAPSNLGDALFIATYSDPDGDCVADNASAGETVSTLIAQSSFSDTVFGLQGFRSTANGAGVAAPSGTTFVNLQLTTDPSVGGSSGTWGYTPVGSPVGCDCNLRDGGRGAGGYGTSVWVPSANLFGQPGALAQQVTGKCGPPVPKCIYQVRSIKIKKDLCGNPSCTDCPYAVGDIICTHDCQTGDDCSGSLRGTSACPKGSVCKVVANLVACDICPRGAKRCR
jgi:hypothetical protein